MAVYKIFSSEDATIYSRFPSANAGLDEILEVSVKNKLDYLNDGSNSNSLDDIRRSLIRFSNSDINTIKSLTTGSFKANLRLYLANAENLNTTYTLEFRRVAQSWEMGTGKFGDSPEVRNGVNWYTSQSYFTTVTNWVNPQYYITAGGGSWTGTFTTQSFDHLASKDINADITPILDSWFSGSGNFGLIVKHPINIESSSANYMALSFFSNDTHTIYPPTLEFKWDDSSYATGSLSVVSDSDTIVSLANNQATFKTGTTKYKFRINSRDIYPVRTFMTSSMYTTNKALPKESYWSIVDMKTGDVVVDFDENYTKISCDPNGNYFTVYMNGLEPERYYKVLVKSSLPSGETVVFDNDQLFKLVN
jgi:hypothetical protein